MKTVTHSGEFWNSRSTSCLAIYHQFTSLETSFIALYSGAKYNGIRNNNLPYKDLDYKQEHCEKMLGTAKNVTS